MSLTIKDIDNGYAKFVANVYDSDGKKLDVGIFSNASNVTYDTGVSVLQVAIWNEFGTPTQPARSFIRAWFDEHQNDVLNWYAAEFLQVLAGQQTQVQALENVGKKCVQGIQNRIEIGVPPPNAASTVAKKGFDHALVESGFMRSVINYRVTGTRGVSPLRVAIEKELGA